MATNDATGPELFPGWSSVVHQPAEEPEETDLPSTVDIAAFSTGLSVEPSSNTQNNEESDSESDSEADSSNTGTDGSQSCSQSDSSDSESSSSQESSSRSPSPEFSVTTSQTNSLRLTIAQIRKPSPEQEKKTDSRKSASKTASSSSGSEASSDSESESEKSEGMSGKEPKPAEGKLVAKNLKDIKKTVGRLRARVAEKKDDKNQRVAKKDAGKNGTNNNMAKTRLRQRKTRKMASLPLSRGQSAYSSSSSSSGTTSSDSDEGGGNQQGSNGSGAGSIAAGGGGTAPAAEGDDSDDADSAMLAGCSLQEIRQEDLAAILPDQQDVDAFNDFDECREDKRSPAGADLSGEGSDMELPQQAVNALIQRTTESSSEGETHAPPPPSSLYANSLLQQFVAQTQMLNAPCPPIPVAEALKPPVLPSNNSETQNKKSEEEGVKKRRGRPKKDLKADKAQEYCTNPNVSPDSGIQNSPDHVSSPEPTLSPNVSQKKPQKEEAKKVEKPSAKNLRNDKSTSNNNNKNNKATVLKPAPANNKVPATTVNNKVSAPNNKLAVTANRFDRMLYANADKVLYPPRRKGGRATTNKKPPSRTVRSKQTVTVAPLPAATAKPVENKVPPPPEKQAKTLKSKIRTRPVLSTKNKMEIKGKYQTLKIPKLMHSKHKHKKHKKYKFKILKPIGENSPKISIEIDKLIADFVKCCAIATKQPKENVPEQILKTLKKVTKKRKTAEYSDKKKKKQNVNTTVTKVSSSDQRLPLKKRHYHLLSNNDSKNEIEEVKTETEEETKCDKSKIKPKVANNTLKTETEDDKADKARTKPKVVPTTPKTEIQKSPVNAKYVPVIKSNTNVKTASINNNEYESKETKTVKDVVSHIDEAIEACINKFADKKVETKTETSVIEDKVNSNSNSITATTPKKRHRLEMANAAEKAIPVIKTEPAIACEEKLEKPKPNINIESYISELKAKRNTVVKPASEEKMVAVKEETNKMSVNNEEALKVTPESKKKVRKRRAINRTGFPTVKKKKKKSLPAEAPASIVPRSSEPRPNSCDRVPKQGEEYTKFVERTENIPEKALTEDSLLSLNRSLDESSKWETMSECESLPQDERTEFDDDCRDRMTLRHRDSSPATSVDTRSSERSKANGDDLDHSLSHSIERLRSRLELRKKRKRMRDRESGTYPKRRSSGAESPYISALKEDRASASGDERKGRKSQAPRWRKKYLVAGLFSDYYKEDDETARLKRQENAQKSSRLVYNPEEHPYGLLPPPYHCGKYLRCRKIPFQLPHDLWWQHTHSQLPGRDIVPSWNYRKIRTNVYTEKLTTTLGSCEPQTCNCRSPSGNTGSMSSLGCGDDCINRLVLSECPPAVGHRCKNQRIQRHEWAPALEKFMTEDKGWGVRTNQSIKSGEFILEYVGEVVSDDEFKRRMASIYIHDTHHYCLHLDGGLVIDGHRMGGDGRFVNHSCQPNCEMQKWSVNGQFRMALFAQRDIQAGEELTYDYNFSLFNPAEGQECKCGSDMCRGVIGGKSQRVRQLPEQAPVQKNPGRVGRPRKTEARKKGVAQKMTTKEVEKATSANTQVLPLMQLKPMSHQQKCFILERHCFLLRNLSKVRKVRDRTLSTVPHNNRAQTATPTDTSTFVNHLNALQKPRNMKTRRLAQAEDDPELNKTVKLAALLKEIWTSVISAKDEKGEPLSTPFINLPSKRKLPDFYTRIQSPIDLSILEQNIATGAYKTPSAFDDDFNKVFRDYVRFYGRTSEIGVAAAKLKKVYVESKKQSLAKFEDVIGEKPPPNFVPNRRKSEEEDIIRCICGIPRDEGLMIQCERCLVWQHCECVKADVSAPSYHCEVCIPREVDYEIPMDEYTEHGHQYFMTLMRGDLQVRQGDTVYVLRDIPIKGTDRKHTYDTIGHVDPGELDIFRIERLWKEKETGRRMAYGHHYLRPHETFHEPTRKFYPNEVMRVPLYEAVPIELIISRCWVLDPNTYCKGRPVGSLPEHIYICEYRVDKGAKMFSKAAKYPVCTKSFAFERFETRLKISRTYCPHDVDASLIKSNARRQNKNEDNSNKNTNNKEVINLVPATPVVRTPLEQKTRLNKILLNLLSKMPTKQVLDVSYLLEGGRRRKKLNDNTNKQ